MSLKLYLRRREEYLNNVTRTTSLWAKHLKTLYKFVLCFLTSALSLKTQVEEEERGKK